MKAATAVLIGSAIASAAACTVKPPSPSQLASLRSAEQVRIVCDQSYVGAEDLELPLEALAGWILGQYGGARTVEADARDYHATLWIEINGEATAREYEDVGEIYSGASVEGKVSFAMRPPVIYNTWFEGAVTPPDFVTGVGPPLTPQQAPYDAALRAPGSFVTVLLEIVADVWSPESLLAATRDSDWGIRLSAIEVLARARHPRAVEFMILAMDDEDTRVRNRIVADVAALEGEEAVVLLLDGLESDKSFVRYKTAWALGEIGHAHAVGPLIALMENQSEPPHIRENAAEALGKIGDERAIEALIDTLRDKNRSVRAEAAQALRAITEQHFGDAYGEWMRWWKEGPR